MTVEVSGNSPGVNPDFGAEIGKGPTCSILTYETVNLRLAQAP